MVEIEPFDLGQHEPAAAEDRRETVKTLSVDQQWQLISAQPCLMRIWHLLAGFLSGSLVMFVYVFGWQRHGATWPMVLPACAYAINAYATVIAFNTIGMISFVNYVGPVNGVLQMYYMIVPLFQEVRHVRYADLQIRRCNDLFIGLSETPGRLQKPFGSTIAHLVALSIDSFLTVILATSTLEAMSPVGASLLEMKSDVLWRGVIQVIRRLDSATDMEVAYILLTQVLHLTIETCRFFSVLMCDLILNLSFISTFRREAPIAARLC